MKGKSALVRGQSTLSELVTFISRAAVDDACVRNCRLPVVILTLYNLQLSTTGKLGYYRWKEHICDFIDAHWVELFGSVR